MADRGTLRTKAVRRAKAREAPLPKPGPAQFPRLRRAICKALDAGRHWTARNTIAACGTWRELEALIERELRSLQNLIDRTELELRAATDDRPAASVRTEAPVRAVRGYEDAVAEYYRRLSRADRDRETE